MRVVEPQMTVTKTVSAGPYEAGDPLTYTIVVSNASGTYSTAAFDLQLTDVFDASLSVLSHSLDIVPAYATATDNSSGNTIDVALDRLDPGDNLTITVQGEHSRYGRGRLGHPQSGKTYLYFPDRHQWHHQQRHRQQQHRHARHFYRRTHRRGRQRRLE